MVCIFTALKTLDVPAQSMVIKAYKEKLLAEGDETILVALWSDLGFEIEDKTKNVIFNRRICGYIRTFSPSWNKLCQWATTVIGLNGANCHYRYG